MHMVRSASARVICRDAINRVPTKLRRRFFQDFRYFRLFKHTLAVLFTDGDEITPPLRHV